mgnify:CR=1 FL=1
MTGQTHARVHLAGRRTRTRRGPRAGRTHRHSLLSGRPSEGASVVSSNASNLRPIPTHCRSCRITQDRSAFGFPRARFDPCRTPHSCLTASRRMFRPRLRLFPRSVLHTPIRLRLVSGSVCPFVLTTRRRSLAHPPHDTLITGRRPGPIPDREAAVFRPPAQSDHIHQTSLRASRA